MHEAKVAVCSEILTKHSTQNEHHVEFFNINPGGNSLVVWWSELLTTNHEAPGSIPVSTVGIFLVGEGSPW